MTPDISLMLKRKRLSDAFSLFMGLSWMVKDWSKSCRTSCCSRLVVHKCKLSLLSSWSFFLPILQGMFWDNQVLSCVVKKCGMSDRHSCSTLWILIFFLSLQFILFDYGLFVFISRHATILSASICMRLVPKRIVLQKMRSYLPIQGNFYP